MGRCGGLAVSMQASFSNYLSSNPGEGCVKVAWKKTKKSPVMLFTLASRHTIGIQECLLTSMGEHQGSII